MTTTPRRLLAGLTAALLGATTVAVLAVAAPTPAGAAEGTGTGTAGQTLTVSDVDGLDRNGVTLTVEGTGYDADAGFDVATMGLYLSVCVDNGPGQTPTPCIGGVDQSGATASTRWITNNPVGNASVVPIAADGSFETTLHVATWDENTDCFDLPEGKSCKIVTRVDHRGSGNRSQDVKVPLDWAAGRRLRIEPTSNVDPDGDDITVVGDGYPTTAPGIYVVYGPLPANNTDATPYQVAAFLPSASIVGGAFTTTLEGVTAVYTGEDEVDYDFRTGGGYVSTFRAHGFPDLTGEYAASQPVHFTRRTPQQSFVTAALTDFLETEPSDSQVTQGVAALQQQGKATYLRTLSTSDAWLSAVVNKLYQDTLGRDGDPGGVAFWVGQLRSGKKTVAQVAASFYASNEYYEGIGGGTPGSWIEDLYEKVLLRPADEGGKAYWVGQVAARGRGNVALRFYQSNESARTRVKNLYQALLGRGTDQAGLAFWAPRVIAQGDLALAVNLAASGEYQTRAEARFP